MSLQTKHLSPKTIEINLPSDSIGRVCSAQISFNHDYRGVVRSQRQALVKILSEPGFIHTSNLSLLWDEVFSHFKRDFLEVYLDLTSGPTDLVGQAATSADKFDFVIDKAWPPVVAPESDKNIIRLVTRKCSTESLGEFGDSYTAALVATDPRADVQKIIERLQAEIESAVSVTLLKHNLMSAYEVVKIITVGSTSRGTYVGGLPDFDVIVLTDIPDNAFEPLRIRAVLDEVVKLVPQSVNFKAYYRALFGNEVSNAVKPLVVTSLGLRGRAGIVGRVSVAGGKSQHGFLDLTFGNLRRAVGYEHWIRRYLEALPTSSRVRLQREIRLAKRVLREFGGIYGTTNRGLRGHVVEQLVVQAQTYRYSGLTVGTFDNFFQLVLEEATIKVDERRYSVLPYKDFKERFPVWNPGSWEEAVGLSRSAEAQNLLDFLGDGDEEIANEKWARLVGLALVYNQYRTQRKRVTSSELIHRARRQCAIEGCNRNLQIVLTSPDMLDQSPSQFD